MSNRSLYLLAATIGGTVGGLLPGLWGGSDFSLQAIILSTVGGLLGVWLAYKYLSS
ncbi:MAG TPA: hypothetical protein VMT30_05980 [Candidatus Saccharimonadia bacterium]|nr:hypothetical protein [Candidatus Saccharimonadia bacterium]